MNAVNEKARDAFRTISEVAVELELPQHVLRFWETRFSQIKPMKRGGGRRYYRPQDIDLLRGIRFLLYDRGYTIKGVQRILKEKGVRFVQEIRSGTMVVSEDAAVADATPPSVGQVETEQQGASIMRIAPRPQPEPNVKEGPTLASPQVAPQEAQQPTPQTALQGGEAPIPSPLSSVFAAGLRATSPEHAAAFVEQGHAQAPHPSHAAQTVVPDVPAAGPVDHAGEVADADPVDPAVDVAPTPLRTLAVNLHVKTDPRQPDNVQNASDAACQASAHASGKSGDETPRMVVRPAALPLSESLKLKANELSALAAASATKREKPVSEENKALLKDALDTLKECRDSLSITLERID